MIKRTWQVPLSIAFFLFGVLVFTQYNTQLALLNSLSMQKPEDLVILVKNLNEKRNALSTEVSSLTKLRDTLEKKASAGYSLATNLDNELKQLKISTGATLIEGPGITISITGGSNLMYLDLVDLINELWVSGAEAISINDQRITLNTVISQGENNNNQMVITIDNKPLLNPIVINGIGNADTLEKGLTFTGGIVDNLNTLYQVYPVIKKEENIRIPQAKNAVY